MGKYKPKPVQVATTSTRPKREFKLSPDNFFAEYAKCAGRPKIACNTWKQHWDFNAGVYHDKKNDEDWHACYIHFHEGIPYLFDPNETTRYKETRFWKELEAAHPEIRHPLRNRNTVRCLQDIQGNIGDMHILSKGVCIAIAFKMQKLLNQVHLPWEERLNILLTCDPTDFFRTYKL